MALSQAVQQLVNAKKWKEAYDKASNEQTTNDDSYIVTYSNSSTNQDGYVKGNATNFNVVNTASEATALSKKDARELIGDIKKDKSNKKADMTIHKRDLLVQQSGTAGSEKGEVIDLFLKERFKQDITSLKDVLVKLIEELGFTNSNPFLVFLDVYLKKNNTPLPESGLILLNDLYSSQDLDSLTLQGKSVDADRHIIFNTNLYSFSEEDADFIFSAFEWLAVAGNIKSHLTNPKALTRYKIANLADLTNERAREIRNEIIFTHPKSYYKSTIKSVDEIQEATRFLEAGGAGARQVDKGKKAININTEVDEEDNWKQLLADKKLTAIQAQDLIAFLAKEFKLV